MAQSNGEPVEISTRMNTGDWTPESLAELTASYQEKLREMGAPEDQIYTEVDKLDDGSVDVSVSWHHQGIETYGSLNQSGLPDEDNARGDGERIPAGEATEDSKGLGAVLGDAEHSAIDHPPTERAKAAAGTTEMPNMEVYTSPEGETYIEELPEKPAP